ncbi:MAG: PKD domain-containing protein [Candidatus Thermoplasmatota archaeon]|nr:PKD domain-containing protein [Candidatus Thermoplasmatota archaeon]
MEERLPIGIEGTGEGKEISVGVVIAIIGIVVATCLAIYFLAPWLKPAEERIENKPPIADFVYSPKEPVIKNTIMFADTSIDEDGWIVNRTWDFGDGNFSYTLDTTHQYLVAGNYSVTLSVTDNNNTTSSKTNTIRVVDHYYFKNSSSIQGSSPEFTENTWVKFPFSIYQHAGWLNITLNYTVTGLRDSQINLYLLYHDIRNNTTVYVRNITPAPEGEKTVMSLLEEEIATVGYGSWGIILHHYSETVAPFNTATYTLTIRIDYQ